MFGLDIPTVYTTPQNCLCFFQNVYLLLPFHKHGACMSLTFLSRKTRP